MRSGFRLRASLTPAKRLNLERETGIEPATNSLEGCDSTTELLPPVNRLSAFSCQLKPQRLKPLFVATLSGTAKAVPFPNLPNQTLEPMTRIELVTSPLPRECSTN